MPHASLCRAHHVVLALVLLGCNSPARTAKPITPFATSRDKVAKHELFRGIKFEELTRTMPDGTVDAIHFNADLSDYVLARVTANVPQNGNDAQFRTEFLTSDGESIICPWAPADASTKETATALFVLPETVTGAKTSLDGARPDQ